MKKILALLAGLCIAAPVHATSADDVKQLVTLIKGTGTTVEARDCGNKQAQGFYQYHKEQNIDLLVVCSNNIDMSDADAVWEVVVHEATHVMQACYGGPLIKDTYVPRMLRELQELAPHYASLLNRYPSAHKRLEVEAFWMELRSPEIPIRWIKDFCYSDD